VLEGWNSLETKDVQLQKPGDFYPAPPETGLLIWPVPSGGTLNIMLPVSVTGDVTVTLTGTTGAVLTSFRTTVSQGIPVVCDCSALPPGLLIVSVRKEPDGPLLRGKAVITRLK